MNFQLILSIPKIRDCFIRFLDSSDIAILRHTSYFFARKIRHKPHKNFNFIYQQIINKNDKLFNFFIKKHYNINGLAIKFIFDKKIIGKSDNDIFCFLIDFKYYLDTYQISIINTLIYYNYFNILLWFFNNGIFNKIHLHNISFLNNKIKLLKK